MKDKLSNLEKYGYIYNLVVNYDESEHTARSSSACFPVF